MISVVKPAWISQSLVRNKQAPIRPFTPDPKLFFSDVSITCADIPTGDKDAIIGAVLALGGMESSSLTKMVTHICALTRDHPKCQQAIQKNFKCKIVLPHWYVRLPVQSTNLIIDRFDDCLKLGKRIDESPYLLPDPEIFRKGPEDSVTIPTTANIEGAVSPRPAFLPTRTDSPTGSGRQLNVFSGKRVMFAEDLGLGNRLRTIIEDIIKHGGGTMTTSVHKADIYVCQYREGRDYVLASRARKDVGNLSWLYHLITHGEWTSPLRRLLHYPLPRQGIPGFDKYRITLSNYGGEARTYLENLVLAAGGHFTKSMKQDNTHLITARKSSEKCAAAAEWNINMINHLWIEESYAKCEVQRLTDPRYTHFPPRTNLGEVIGQTQFEATVLESIYFPRDPTPSLNDPKPSRHMMHHLDDNTAITRTSDADTILGRSSHENSAVTRDPEDAYAGNSRKGFGVPALPRRKSAGMGTAIVQPFQAATTPSSNRRTSLGKENETPSSTNSRSAKDRALSKLHDLAPDVALYEKEKKRSGKGVWGGKRAANQIEKEKVFDRDSPSPDNDENDCSEEEGRTPKRARTSLPPVQMRLLITGYKQWLGNFNKEDAEKVRIATLIVCRVLITCCRRN